MRREKSKTIMQRGLKIKFETEYVDNYMILITWEIYNSFQPDEMGIRAMSLLKVKDEPPYSALAKIRATEGVSEWHE